MLRKLLEWYRLAELKPSDDELEKRKSSINKLLEEVSENDDHDLLVWLVSSTINGVAENRSDDKHTKLLIDLLANEDISFPRDLSENEMILRACSSIALGELLDAKGESALTVSALLVSGLGFRPYAPEPHLAKVQQELHRLSLNYMNNEGEYLREREELNSIDLEGRSPESFTNKEWLELLGELVEQIETLKRNSESDREELNVLGWLYARHSKLLGEDFNSLDIGKAALSFGGELGTICLIPPTEGERNMIRRHFRTSEDGNKELTLEELANSFDGRVVQVFSNFADKSLKSDLAPVLLPLTWLSKRLKESGFSQSWQSEFEHRVGCSYTVRASAEIWAIQVFNELVAHRVVLNTMEL